MTSNSALGRNSTGQESLLGKDFETHTIFFFLTIYYVVDIMLGYRCLFCI